MTSHHVTVILTEVHEPATTIDETEILSVRHRGTEIETQTETIDYGWQRVRDFDRSGPRDRPLIGPEFQSQCIDLYCVWIVSEMTYNVLMGTLNIV